MPALNTNITTQISLGSDADNATEVLQVVCAWPVSGQYGPGSRVLYYVLIATCLLARKVDRLINAFLAVGLILPAVAALHGIVLAALHKEGAVDMDIYGAFQLCSIGILAAPVTVMMSRTFFNDPGRNVMFMWILLVLMGLMCLGIEFYRIHAVPCEFTDSTRRDAVPSAASDFPYSGSISCGLPCSPEEGPKSPMRGGAADNVYVIPAPSVLTFGTATLLAAACCIHAILCLLSMWNKVISKQWKLRLGRSRNEPVDANERSVEERGTDKLTVESINKTIGHFLEMVAIPVFGGAGVAIVILGELNFFSPQVRFQTEPMASVGQWAPIAATALAMIGSLYLILAVDTNTTTTIKHDDTAEHSLQPYSRGRTPASPAVPRNLIVGTTTNTSTEDSSAPKSTAGRRKFALLLNRMGEVLGSPPRALTEEEMGRSRAQSYPFVPGETSRTADLDATVETYSAMRSASRATSFRGDSPSTPPGSRSVSPHPQAAPISTPARTHSTPLANNRTHGEVQPPSVAHIAPARRISSPR